MDNLTKLAMRANAKGDRVLIALIQAVGHADELRAHADSLGDPDEWEDYDAARERLESIQLDEVPS